MCCIQWPCFDNVTRCRLPQFKFKPLMPAVSARHQLLQRVMICFSLHQAPHPPHECVIFKHIVDCFVLTSQQNVLFVCLLVCRLMMNTTCPGNCGRR